MICSVNVIRDALANAVNVSHREGWVHIIVSKRNVSKQLLSNQNHAEPIGDK